MVWIAFQRVPGVVWKLVWRAAEQIGRPMVFKNFRRAGRSAAAAKIGPIRPCRARNGATGRSVVTAPARPPGRARSPSRTLFGGLALLAGRQVTGRAT